jgi:cell division GTPase FtsZ
VQEALTSLQEQTSSQTEIVFGVIQDERMSERVQLTLVVTGLGAPTLEEALSQVSLPLAQESPRSISAPQTSAETQPAATRPLQTEPILQAAPALAINDLDLPAFLRRRARLTGSNPG